MFAAGTPAADAQPDSAAGSDAPAPAIEIVKRDIDLEAAPDGHFWMVEEVHYRPLNDQGVEALQQIALSYTAGYQRQSVTAYNLKKGGTRIDVPPADILRGRGQTTMPGFEDVQTQTVVFPNVAVGDELVMITAMEQLVPWFPNIFALNLSFSRDVVTREATVAVTTRANDSLFKIIASGLEAEPPQTLGGKTRRVWHFHNDQAEKPDPERVREFEDNPHVEITTLSDYADVGKLYAGIFRDKAKVTPAISALADQVTTGISDKRAQATALYNWVATHIQYVDIVLGAGGFIPNDADTILKNGHGDCKDHVMLLEALLAAKGIESSAVLIRAGVSQFRLPAAASPFLFDHLITYVPEFSLYLDSTAKYAPFGVLPGVDSGKDVVIVESGKKAVTPATSVNTSTLHSETVLKVNEDGSADGDTKISANGSVAIDMRAMVASLPKDNEDNYFRAALGAGSGGKLQRGDPTDLAQTYEFSAHYHIGHLANFPGPGAFPARLGYAPFSFGAIIGASLPPSRGNNYACFSGTFSEAVTLVLPHGVKKLELPPTQTIAAAGTILRLNYRKTKPDTVVSQTELREDHPAPVCAPDYYAKVRPALSRMSGALQSQILYR